MKLFMSSFFNKVSNKFCDFANEDLSGKKVAFIATAAKYEKVTFYIKSAKKTFDKLGMNIVDLDISSNNNIKEIIDECDYIYVSGGNSFYLLEQLKNSKADEIIIDAIKNGKPYIGESAGSIVLSKNIKYVETMDDKSIATTLTSYDGLSLVDFSIVPHYGCIPFKKITKNIMETYDDKMISINNQEAVTVDNDKITVV